MSCLFNIIIVAKSCYMLILLIKYVIYQPSCLELSRLQFTKYLARIFYGPKYIFLDISYTVSWYLMTKDLTAVRQEVNSLEGSVVVQELEFAINVKRMQRSGIEAIRTQIQSSKPKRKITDITNNQNTKRTYGQPSEQLFLKRWPLSNRTEPKIIRKHIKGYVSETLTPKTCNRELQQNYRLIRSFVKRR